MISQTDRRTVVVGLGAVAAGLGAQRHEAEGQAMESTIDVVLFNGKVTTLDRQTPAATALAIRNGRFSVVGSDDEVMRLAGASTQRIDLNGRRVIPGLIDSHMHIIREGLNYNMELRWDGVRSLADAMRMLKDQVDRTPAPQWVRVVGGFTEHQFAEKRLPTLDEINAVAPDTPVFILHLYDRALLNRAALRAVGYTKATPEPPGAEIVRDSNGEPTGLLVAKPNAGILYATLAKGPKLPPDYQKNSTRHFLREVNRLGVTGVIDAGGGYQNYPDDYAIIEELHREGELTVRIAYNLFPQRAGHELEDFTSWTKQVKFGQGDDVYRKQWRRRNAGLHRPGFRRLPCRTPRYAARHGGRARSRGAASCGKSLALAITCHLQRDDHACAQRVREGEPRYSLRWFALVHRPRRDD
jgi:predicted amidohydrolase YtcJ